jgi:hypothetical protein
MASKHVWIRTQGRTVGIRLLSPFFRAYTGGLPGVFVFVLFVGPSSH